MEAETSSTRSESSIIGQQVAERHAVDSRIWCSSAFSMMFSSIYPLFNRRVPGTECDRRVVEPSGERFHGTVILTPLQCLTLSTILHHNAVAVSNMYRECYGNVST